MVELEALYSADEMRAAESGHDVDALMQRAGAAVADALMRRFPDARRIALHAGGGANGGDGRIAAEILQAQGLELVDERPDLVLDAGRFHAGEVEVADIGLEPAETEHRLVTAEILAEVPRRSARDNKYTAGHVLVVGGSRGMTGAAALAARAAFRADAGYVTIAAPAESIPVLETLV